MRVYLLGELLLGEENLVELLELVGELALPQRVRRTTEVLR
jgi:hypothetical protein